MLTHDTAAVVNQQQSKAAVPTCCLASRVSCVRLCVQVRQVLSYERDRVRFLLKAYLRARLDKIQRFAGVCLCAGCCCNRMRQAECCQLWQERCAVVRKGTSSRQLPCSINHVISSPPPTNQPT